MTSPLFHVVETYREIPRVDFCWKCSCGVGRLGYMTEPGARIAADRHRFEEINRRIQLPPKQGAA